MSTNITNLMSPASTWQLPLHNRLWQQKATSGRLGANTPEGTIVLEELPKDISAYFEEKVVATVKAGLTNYGATGELWFLTAHDPSAASPEELDFANHILACMVETNCICAQHRSYWARAIMTYLYYVDGDEDLDEDPGDTAKYRDELFRLAELLDPVTVWADWQQWFIKTQDNRDPFTTEFEIAVANCSGLYDGERGGDAAMPTVLIHNGRATIVDSASMKMLFVLAKESLEEEDDKEESTDDY